MKHVNIGGIKCDNPKCDYNDMSVLFEEYPEYLNKPCPKCGENLLTQECYDECFAVDDAIGDIRKYLPENIENIENILENSATDYLKNAVNDFEAMTPDEKTKFVLNLHKMMKEMDTEVVKNLFNKMLENNVE